MDFMLWNVKGYSGVNLTKDKLNSNKFSFTDIKESSSDVVKKVEKTIDNGGVVLALSKKKVIKGLYFFKVTKDGTENVLVFDKMIMLDEVNKCVDEFENDIENILSHILFNRHDIDKAIWHEKEITKNKRFMSRVKIIKTLTMIGIAISCIVSLALVMCSTFYSVEVSNSSMVQIKENKLVINYISKLNNYDYIDCVEAIENFEEFSVGGLVVGEIIVPTLFKLFGLALIVISLKELNDLIHNVTDNKMLFTYEKTDLLRKSLLYAVIGLLFILNNLILWFIIGVIFEVFYYLFSYCNYLINKK